MQLVADNGDAIAARTGLRLEVTRVAVRDVTRPRPVDLAPGVLTDDAAGVVADPDVDLVVEVIGGIEPARTLILAALKAGKPVVTANKELLANLGAELFEAAAKSGVDLLFEAAVGGGIPLIRPLRESLAGDRISRVIGIVNGTTNFILTRMTEEGDSFADALAEAQALGYAERDPTADVEGFDAAAKAAIIASVAFGVDVRAGDVYREGISGITADDIALAARLGYVVKLLAVAEEPGPGGDRWRCGSTRRWSRSTTRWPRCATPSTPCSSRATPSASSCSTAGAPGDGRPPPPCWATSSTPPPTAPGHVGLGGGRRPGHRPPPADRRAGVAVLPVPRRGRPARRARQVADAFARHEVSIVQVLQLGMGDEARLVFVTHTARERDMQATVAELRELDVVDRVGSLLRVIGPE